MRLARETPEPKVAEQLETMGGAYHRLESTFRPVEKTSRAAAKALHRPQKKAPQDPKR